MLTTPRAALSAMVGARPSAVPAAPATTPEGARDRLLTPAGFPGIQVLHATVQPGGHSPGAGAGRPEESHFLLVLRGTFTLQLNGTAEQLCAGQSITFRGTDSYSWANLSADTPCEVLWVLSPPAI